MRHYLVTKNDDYVDIAVYTLKETDLALDRYAEQERLGKDCVLLGAEHIFDLMVTHANWFDRDLVLYKGH